MLAEVSLYPFCVTITTPGIEEKQNLELQETRIKEIFLFEQFEATELETFFRYFAQIVCEYRHILSEIGSVYHSTSLIFPLSSDHFNNLEDSNCFRGRLARVPIVGQLEFYNNQVINCSVKLEQLAFPPRL